MSQISIRNMCLRNKHVILHDKLLNTLAILTWYIWSASSSQ